MRSFHPIWNPDMAVRVLSRLRTEGIDASLVMGGADKGYLAETRELARALHVADHVRFVGFLGPKDKAREGDVADIFLNTNRIDNMPVAVIEACAMGLPVVSTNVGGIPDLLTQGATGLLVASEDDEAMTGCVRRLLREPALCRNLSTNGRQLAERCSWPVVRQQWLELFRQLDPQAFPNSVTGHQHDEIQPCSIL
jgi:glycosyltransferase involved in cell wall biosynthesis